MLKSYYLQVVLAHFSNRPALCKRTVLPRNCSFQSWITPGNNKLVNGNIGFWKLVVIPPEETVYWPSDSLFTVLITLSRLLCWLFNLTNETHRLYLKKVLTWNDYSKFSQACSINYRLTSNSCCNLLFIIAIFDNLFCLIRNQNSKS